MKPEFVLVVVIICLAMMTATPALTASRQIQDYCSKLAIRANATFWHRGDSAGECRRRGDGGHWYHAAISPRSTPEPCVLLSLIAKTRLRRVRHEQPARLLI
jgi:hypothetical protein